MTNKNAQAKFEGCKVVMEHALAIIWLVVVLGVIAWLFMKSTGKL